MIPWNDERRRWSTKRTWSLWALRRAACALALGLAVVGCKSKSKQQAAVGGMGSLVSPGEAVDLRLSPDGAFATYLTEIQKPRVDGIPPQLVLGELYVVALSRPEVKAKKLANGVTNAPGGYLFSPDSKWVMLLEGYNLAAQSGELVVKSLTDWDAPTRKLGRSVSYMVASADGRFLAFVDDGVLKLGPLEGGPYREVAGEVSIAQFAPDNETVFFKRRISAAGGLYAVSIGDSRPPIKLADQVGDYVISPDSKQVAFAQRSDVNPGTYDLFLASAPTMKPKKIGVGTTVFGFSPDGRYFARTEGAKLEQLGDLFVGPPDGTGARKIAEKVDRFSFAPDSSAIAYLEKYDIPSRLGLVGVTTLPDGKPKPVGGRCPNYIWSADSKHIAYLSRFLKPVVSVDLMLYRVGDEKPVKVHPGVFGYGFGPKGEYLLFRSNCIREGRACDLFVANLEKPQEPKKIIEGVYSFKSSDDGQRVLVTYARMKGETYDAAVYNLKSNVYKTVEQTVHLPAYFVDPSGANVAYLVADPARAGLYLARNVP